MSGRTATASLRYRDRRRPQVNRHRQFPLVMAHETPGDSRVRALPSPVCTGRAGRQSRRQETVTDSGECPAQGWHARGFAITNGHRPLAVLPNPHKGRLLPVCCLPPRSCRSHGTRGRKASVSRPGPAPTLSAWSPCWPPSTTTAATRARTLARSAPTHNRYRRRVVDSPSMRPSSSSVSEKPNTSKLAAIRSGVADLGITTTSWSTCQRTTT